MAPLCQALLSYTSLQNRTMKRSKRVFAAPWYLSNMAHADQRLSTYNLRILQSEIILDLILFGLQR